MGIQIAVGMTSCTRRCTANGETVDYSSQTLDQMVIAGLTVDSVHIDYGNELGSYGCFRRLLRRLLYKESAGMEADAFLIVQDDIQITEKIGPFLQEYLFKDKRVWNERTGIVSLYTAAVDHDEHVKILGQDWVGWHKIVEPAQGKLHGALAVLMSRPVALRFDANPPFPGAMSLTDNWLAEFCKRENLDIWLHSPSFVKHIGEVSAIDNGGDGPSWPAEHIAKYRQCKEFCQNVNDLKKLLAKTESSV